MTQFPSQPNLNMPAFGPSRVGMPSPNEQMRVPQQGPPAFAGGGRPMLPPSPQPPTMPQMPPATPVAAGGGNPFAGYQPGSQQGPANANAILAALAAAGVGNGHLPTSVGPSSGQMGGPPAGFGGGRPIGVGRPRAY